MITISSGQATLSTISTGTGSYTINSSLYGEKRLVKVEIKDITVELSYRESVMYTYAVAGSNSTVPDRIWKEIYGLKDGKMTLLEVVQGKHILAYSVPERFVFDDDPDIDGPNGH